MSLRRGFGRIAQSRGKTIVLQKPKIEYTERVDQPGWSAKSRCVGSVPKIAQAGWRYAILPFGAAAPFALYALSTECKNFAFLSAILFFPIFFKTTIGREHV